MIRSRVPKDEELTEDNLVGKSIVDPDGNIIAKCIALFEDEKKKMRMRIAIKTDIDSDFTVKETIPLSLISKIGEVILLKKSFEIEPVSVQDIIQIEIPEVAEHSDGTEQDLVVALRKSDSFVPELSLVAEIDGKIAGHIMFTEGKVGNDKVLVLAPLAMAPEYL